MRVRGNGERGLEWVGGLCGGVESASVGGAGAAGRAVAAGGRAAIPTWCPERKCSFQTSASF